MSYTYALLDVSSATFDEIRRKLDAAGYADQFDDDGKGGIVIDMHGIALSHEPGESHVGFRSGGEREVRFNAGNSVLSLKEVLQRVVDEQAEFGGTLNFNAMLDLFGGR